MIAHAFVQTCFVVPDLEAAMHEWLDRAAIDSVREAIDTWEPSLPSEDMLAETKDWYVRWKTMHPQFNSAEGQQFLAFI